MALIWQLLHIMWVILPIALPAVSIFIAWELRLDYVRRKFAASNPRILLEIKLPQVIEKSPLAMELVLTALYITSREGTFVDRNFKGQSRPYFSLEIVSINGQVHFFVWTEANYKNLIEAQIYAQYPGIEIFEVADYTQGIKYSPAENQVWGCEFTKEKDTHALPIKTYIDYGMDKNPDEELKIDPITPTIEFLGSVKEDQQIWMQIVLRAHKKERRIYNKDKSQSEKVDWTHAANEERKKIFDKLKDKSKPDAPARRLTKGEEEIVNALERNTSKLPFDVGIRVVYVSKKEAFNRMMIAGIMGITRQYNTKNLNGFKPVRTTSFDYPWQDFRNKRVDAKKASMIKNFRQRRFFGLPGAKLFVMSTEELATMYHFPGGVSMTPTFSRIMSKKSEPPANLPS